ncbi:right-handed parallel beta-helix repeat-containing protein [Ruminococcus sp.]|uniref:right-handed parallel beta-helix repeat-containing protein n=1 Tax=Ruminococcus sp. TaxID=41978 RepID=UPI0025FF83D4|nr:right-handed parallel beta-helix repeat-containing protein [Ruminococcus sp.]
MISKRLSCALSKGAAAIFAAVLLASGHFVLSAHAYDYNSITGGYATGAGISGYDSAIAIDVTDFKADSSGSKDSAPAIQKALDYAADHSSDSVQVKVIVPAGTYNINSTLWIHSNTWLFMEGATLRKNFSGGCMIMNYRDDLGKGYNGSHNIIIEGGCLDGNTNGGNTKAFSAVRMGHLHDLWVKDVDFKDNYNCHMLELGGIKNVTIEGCSFHEYYGPKYKEAIQFDILNNSNLFSGYAPFDDTACDNVIIRNNNFYDLMRGIGSHSATIGVYYTNFLITGNTFNNIYDSAIIMENYRQCTIDGNTMTSVGSGIDFKNMTYLEQSGYNAPVAGYDGVYDRLNDFSDTIMRNNTIVTNVTSSCPKPAGIKLYGKLVQNTAFPDHDYKVEGVLIESNNITTAGSAIQMTDASGVLVNANTLGTPAEGEIYENSLLNVKYSADVSVKNNNLMGSNSHSISITGGTGGVISGNTCKDSTVSAIKTEKNAKVKISGNTIENPAVNGIEITDGTKAEVSDNTITGAAENGIRVKDADDVKITGNTVSSCGTAGISAAEGAAAYVDNNSFAENSGDDYLGEIFAMPVTNFGADGVYGDHIQLSWQSGGGSDGYSVKRRLAGSEEDFEEVAVVNTPSYTDDALPSNTKYEYKVDSMLDIGENVTESSSDTLTVKTKASLSECTAEIEPVYKYSGKKIEPDPVIMMNGCRLKRDVDYKLKYYNNLAAGKATVAVSGCGEYFGFMEFEFEIRFSEGAAVPPAAGSGTFTEDTSDKYEVLAVTAAETFRETAPVINSEIETDDLLGAINNAKCRDKVRIYSRRISAAGSSGMWF